MKSLNLVQLIGNVTKDPEIKVMENSGAKLATIGLATNEVWNDKHTGEKKQKTEFHNLVVWGALAEVFEKWVKKGDPIYVSGKMETRSWEDKDSGKKMYRTEVIVRDMNMLGGRKDNDGSTTRQDAPAPQEEALPDVPNVEHQPSISVEDLPF